MAIEARYQGSTYEEIMGILLDRCHIGVKPQTIRTWFMRDGMLYDAYINYAQKQNDGLRKMMFEETRKLVQKIPGKLSALMDRVDSTGKPDAVVLMTIKTLFEVLGITPDAEKGQNDKLKEYFDKLESMPNPRDKMEQPEAPKNQSSIILLEAPKNHAA